MEATATATVKNIRISPRKVRLVLGLIRGLDVATAMAYLDNTQRAAVPPVRTLLKSVMANADNKGMDVDNLRVHAAYANEGTTLKRFRPRAMGRAARILKRTSHITLVVTEE